MDQCGLCDSSLWWVWFYTRSSLSSSKKDVTDILIINHSWSSLDHIAFLITYRRPQLIRLLPASLQHRFPNYAPWVSSPSVSFFFVDHIMFKALRDSRPPYRFPPISPHIQWWQSLYCGLLPETSNDEWYRIPTFEAARSEGYHSSHFDLSANLSEDDRRQLDLDEVRRIMSETGCNFDQVIHRPFSWFDKLAVTFITEQVFALFEYWYAFACDVCLLVIFRLDWFDITVTWLVMGLTHWLVYQLIAKLSPL